MVTAKTPISSQFVRSKWVSNFEQKKRVCNLDKLCFENTRKTLTGVGAA